MSFAEYRAPRSFAIKWCQSMQAVIVTNISIWIRDLHKVHCYGYYPVEGDYQDKILREQFAMINFPLMI